MTIEKQQTEIANIENEIHSAIKNEQHAKAKRLIRNLDKYCLVLETTKVSLLAAAQILIAEGKEHIARQKLLSNMGYCWGSAKALELLRSLNQAVNDNCQVYFLEIKGGIACIGSFSIFSSEHIVSMLVIAEKISEAEYYMNELCQFAEPNERQVLRSDIVGPVPDGCSHKGVLEAFPFRL